MIEIFATKGNEKENKLIFHNEAVQSKYQLYWSYEPTKEIKEQQFLLEITQASTKFQLPSEVKKEYRVYFQLRNVDNGEVRVVGQRILPVKGMLNFRDMGGFPTQEGKHVKWGLLYRSDYFWILEDESLDYVKNLGIKTIIDYRGQTEIDERPNKFIGEKQTVFCDPKAATAAAAGILQSGDVSKSVEELMYEQAVRETAISPNAGTEKMLEQQKRFVNEDVSKGAFSRSLTTIATTENSPIVQHCRGGKDRTGYGSMLLMAALGVSEEDILYDFMLTKVARAERSKFLYEKYQSMYDDQAIINYLYSFFDLQEEFILTSIAEIKSRHVTILDYIEKELHITPEQIQEMRKFYLE